MTRNIAVCEECHYFSASEHLECSNMENIHHVQAGDKACRYFTERGLVHHLKLRIAKLEADARLGRMVRAAREAVLDYDMPFHQCTCCGGCHVYDVELCRFVARHTPDCAWAALVKVIKSEPEGGKHEGFDIGRDRAIGK